MKKLILILLTFMSFTSIAQMQVKENSFHQIDGFVMLDKNEHYDDNNLPMALIKISTENITAEERRRITFKGNLATYFDVHFEPTEIHLYISAQSATFLEIHHPDYGKTEFILPFDLKDFCGYEMVLQYVPIVAADIQNTSSKYNTITIIADQEDAIIYVDNEVTHDNICVKSFPVGSTHTWKIECELYHSESGDITITEGNPIVVEKKLNKAHGFLNIVSTPQNDAIIYLNDNEIGVTPFKSNKIASGIYKLKLEKESYKIIEQDVEITDGDTTNLVLNMQIDYADVTINTDSQSEIYIDGNYIGRGNWSGNLVEGKHIIESKKTHHKTIVKNIDIIAEKTEHIIFEPPTLVHENIDINTEPTGEINGYEYVDLGLPSGIKWATKNIGEGESWYDKYGEYFLWGIGRYDLAESRQYYFITSDGYYKVSKKEKKRDKYRECNTNVDIKGKKKYDIATTMLGTPWRLPSKNDFEELIDECIWIWMTQNGINGYLIIGPNSNSIFLPAGGSKIIGTGMYEYPISYDNERGYYWSSTPSTEGAYSLCIDKLDISIKVNDRYIDCNTVRPVCGESVESIKDIVITTGNNSDEIYIDDDYVGISPFTTSLPYGEYKIKAVRKDSTNQYVSNIVISDVKINKESGYYVNLKFKSKADLEKQNNTILLSISIITIIIGLSLFFIKWYKKKNNIVTEQIKTFDVKGVVFKMVEIRGGSFRMGCSNYTEESPVHLVKLSDYYIGESEVSQELWEAVMGNNPSCIKGEQRPVDNISWEDCQEFIYRLNELTRMNFRLPTEAEWEYAARGGNKTNGYIYSGSNNIKDIAWCNINKHNVCKSPQNIKTKMPNELGIYDMSGNVWEWCHDWYGKYSNQFQTNPQGPTNGCYRILRGGSWRIGSEYCRVSNRNYADPTIGHGNRGLRLAL